MGALRHAATARGMRERPPFYRTRRASVDGFRPGLIEPAHIGLLSTTQERVASPAARLPPNVRLVASLLRRPPARTRRRPAHEPGYPRHAACRQGGGAPALRAPSRAPRAGGR